MPFFKKKPVVIRAVQLTEDNRDEVLVWLGANAHDNSNNRPHIVIHTLEGQMVACVGDWIIEGVEGEFYPCKPDIFDATYDRL